MPGVNTKAWGPHAWNVLHSVAYAIQFGYQEEMQKFVESFRRTLPCVFCRDSMALFMQQVPLQAPYPLWVYRIHNCVNRKLFLQQPNLTSRDFQEYVPRYRDVEYLEVTSAAFAESMSYFLYYACIDDVDPADMLKTLRVLLNAIGHQDIARNLKLPGNTPKDCLSKMARVHKMHSQLCQNDMPLHHRFKSCMRAKSGCKKKNNKDK